MPSPPPAAPDALSQRDILAEDRSAFVPKLEDNGVVFPSFDGSASDSISLAASMGGVHVPFVPSSSQSLAPLELLESVPSEGSETFLQNFSQELAASSLSSVSDEMQGVSMGREASPGSVHTSSSNPSLAASPAPALFGNSTTSLSSSIDETNAALLNRSRSGSLASPGATAFAHRASPPNSSQDASLKFQISQNFGTISRPDPASTPHMAVVDNVLDSIMRSAHHARQACSLGQGAEATCRVDEMKKQIMLVANLLSATMLDAPGQQTTAKHQQPGAAGLGPQAAQGHRHSLSLPGVRHSQAPGMIPNFPNVSFENLSPSIEQPAPTSSGAMALDMHTSSASQSSPDSDTTRKRCASSMAGDRVNKALRLDSFDGNLPPPSQASEHPPVNISMPPPGSVMLSGSQSAPALVTSNGAPMPVGVHVAVSNGQILSNPLSAPLVSMSLSTSPTNCPSRPSSPSIGQASNRAISWSLIQKQPSTTIHPISQPPPAFAVSIGGTTSIPLSDAVKTELELSSPTTLGDAWPDMTNQNSIPTTLSQALNTIHLQDLSSPTSLSFGVSNFQQPVPLYMPAEALSRGSRSSSISGPIAPDGSINMTTSAPLAASIGFPTHSDGVSISAAGSLPPVSVGEPPQSLQDFVLGQMSTSNITRRSRTLSRVSLAAPRSPSSSSCEDDGESDYEGGYGRMQGLSYLKTSPPLKSRDSSGERMATRQQRSSGNSPNEGQGTSSANHGNDIPPEYRAEIDRIFFEFLNRICSNLDATDAKGELIHQTLMAKKMQRLDESPDFRPFKFRIQAFTNGFLEELARQGYPEEKIAMKKVRNYLWTQQYISRFNEDGKKAKSKGNHIWNIDAKKKAEGGWEFRPFHRKLAGTPPSVAYTGLRWTWMPRIWDPQASRANIQVQYSSPNLPSWLSWRDGCLQGTPPPDAQTCDVTVEARTVQDGREELLKQTFTINVAPIPTGTEMSFGGSRSSLASDPRRVNSDSVVSNTAGVAALPMAAVQPTLAQPPTLTTQDAQMLQVLTSAAQRVAQEAHAQIIASQHPNDPPGHELQSLAKQQHVLTVTVQALDQEVSAPPEEIHPSSHALVAVAQQVVLQAARQAAVDKTAVMSYATGLPATQGSTAAQVTVNDVSVATQTAVAQAVEITGPLSSEVHVMMTASSLLQQQQASRPSIETAPLQPSMDTIRPHSAGTIASSFPGLLPHAMQSFPPVANPPLSSMESIEF